MHESSAVDIELDNRCCWCGVRRWEPIAIQALHDALPIALHQQTAFLHGVVVSKTWWQPTCHNYGSNKEREQCSHKTIVSLSALLDSILQMVSDAVAYKLIPLRTEVQFVVGGEPLRMPVFDGAGTAH
jgi:hypothetical protein